MAENVGNYDISFLMAAKESNVKKIGVDLVAQILQDDLAVHNQIMADMLNDLCEISTDARRVIGASSSNDMVEVDEFGLASTQRVANPYSVFFPLHKYSFNTGWTADFMANAPASEVAQKQLDAEQAHRRKIQTLIKEAIFRKDNITNARDFMVDNVSLNPIVRFYNGDGNAIPNGAAGETFSATTHLHYISTGTATVTDVTSLINTVVEHGHGNQMILAINRADEATVKAYSGFTALQPAWLINPMYAAASGVPTMALDVGKVDNRMIGYLGAAEVWVKSWVPDNYYFAYDAGDSRKPLVARVKAGYGVGLNPNLVFGAHPLSTQNFELYIGFGAWTRGNGAVLYTGNDTWSDGV